MTARGERMVQVTIVYESMFGATRRIAEAIARGIEGAAVPDLRVALHRVDEVTAQELADSDVLVLGGPTHAHSMSREATRQEAKTWSEDPDQDLTFESGTSPRGIRELLEALPSTAAPSYVSFDTRLDAPEVFTGSAARAIRRRLAKRSMSALLPPQSFLVGKDSHLLPGEEDRAEKTGRALAAAAGEHVPGARQSSGA